MSAAISCCAASSPTAPSAPAPTIQVKRVCWAGDLPQRGDILLSEGGRVAWHIRSVTVLHYAPAAARPRLLLRVRPYKPAQAPAGGVVHPYSRAVPEAAPAAPPGRGNGMPAGMGRGATAEQRAEAARAARVASETAPPAHADEAAWDDPEDTAQTKAPRRVRGHRRGDVLGRMSRRGDDLTREHVEAGNRLRVDLDVARLGRSSAEAFAERVGGSASVPLGPKVAALAQTTAQRQVARVRRALEAADAERSPRDPHHYSRLMWVLIGNRDIAAWCATLRSTGVDGLNPQRERRRLIASLDELVRFYGIGQRRKPGA